MNFDNRFTDLMKSSELEVIIVHHEEPILFTEGKFCERAALMGTSSGRGAKLTSIPFDDLTFLSLLAKKLGPFSAPYSRNGSERKSVCGTKSNFIEKVATVSIESPTCYLKLYQILIGRS